MFVGATGIGRVVAAHRRADEGARHRRRPAVRRHRRRHAAALPQLPLQRVARPVRRRDVDQRRQLLRRRAEGPLPGGAPRRRSPAARRDAHGAAGDRRPDRRRGRPPRSPRSTRRCATTTSPTARRASTAGTARSPRSGLELDCRTSASTARSARSPATTSAPTARLVDDGEWRAATSDWLPTDERPRARRVADGAACTEPGKMAGWVAPPVDGHPRQAGRLRVRARSDTTIWGDAMADRTTQLRGCSIATSRPGAATAWRSDVDGESTTYAELQREVWRAQHALRASTSRRGERVVLVVNDELAFSAWFLGAHALRRRARAAVDDAHRADLAAIVADAGAERRRRLGLALRRRDRCGHRGMRRRCGTSSAIGSATTTVRGPVHAWSDVHDRRRGTGGRHRRRLAGVLAVQLGHDRRPKGVMHRHANPQATATTYARRGARHRRRRPLPVRGQAVLRLRPRQLADVPARRRCDGDPRTRDARRRPGRRARREPSSRRCSSPAPGSSPALLDADVAGRRVRVGAGDGDRRRGAARRPPAAVHRALRSSRARRHRHDRGAAHLPVQPARRANGPARAAGPCRATRRGSSTTHGADVTEPTRRATSTCAARRSPPVLEPRRGDARRVPGRAGCAPATCTPAPPTATGRSSAATAT